MITRPGLFTAGVALLFAASLVSGCAGPPVPSTPSPGEAPPDSPVPTETESEASPAVVVIGAQKLTIQSADGAILQELPFTDEPADAIDALSEVFDGDPVLSEVEPAECVHAESTARWGEDDGFVVGHGPDVPLPTDLQFHVSAQSDSVGDVAIETPTGFSVGDSLDELLASTPDATVEAGEFQGVLYERVHYEVIDTRTGQWGAYAWAEDDMIQGLAGGFFLTGDC